MRKASRRRNESDSAESHALPEHEPADGPQADEGRADWTRNFLLQTAIIVLAGLWIYSPAYHGDWLWDDDQAITANPVTQGPWSFRDIWLAPPGADYFPLTATGFWLEWHAFGPVPTGYHIVNVVLHILGALAFWRLLHVMKLPGAWLGGLLFAIHPVCIESVTWVSELKFLLSATSFVKFDEAVGAGTQGSSRATRDYVLAIVFFLLAMLAKTAIVMYPLMILLYGWWKHGFRIDRAGIIMLALVGGSLALTLVPEMAWMKIMREGKSTWMLFTICGAVALLGPLSSLALASGLFRRLTGQVEGSAAPARMTSLAKYSIYALPFFWISLVLGLATCYFQWSRAIGQEAIPVGGVASRIATAGMAILFYLWKTIWPFNLLTIYPRWEVDPPKLWQFLPWPIILGGGAWLWWNRGTAQTPTWQRHVLFVLGFFVLGLFPILGFITISYMRITWVADHFLYLPMISVIGLASTAAATWYARAKPAEQPVALATAAILLAGLGFSSFRYAHAWAGEETLWPHTIAGHPNPCHQGCGCWQAHNRLGAKKFAKGDIEAGFYHFTNSTRLRPDLGETHNNLGTALSAKGRLNEAIKEFAEACRVTPHVPAIRVNLANALAAAGRFGEAGDRYYELLQNEPNNPALLNNYGVTLYKQGRKEEAIVQFRKALSIAPNLKDARDSLAVALGEKPDPNAPNGAQPPEKPAGGQVPQSLPTSPTLGPSPMSAPADSFDPLRLRQ